MMSRITDMIETVLVKGQCRRFSHWATVFSCAKVITVFLLCVIATPVTAATITFFDGDFNPTDYSSIVTGSGSSTAITEPSGGTPGAYRRVSLTVEPFQSVWNVQLFLNAVYTPKDQGPIQSVQVSYDIRRVFTTHPHATQIHKGISVEQDSVIYSYFGGNSTSTTWEPFAVSDIIPFFPQVNWSDGNQIMFGFYDAVGTSEQGFTLDGGYDNFTVEISPVPLPCAVWLFGCGLLSLMGLRRYRR